MSRRNTKQVFEIECPNCRIRSPNTTDGDLVHDSFKVIGSGAVATVLRCLYCGHEFAVYKEQLIEEVI